MTGPWPGVIEAFRDRLPVTAATPVITLLEGNTPLLEAPRLASRTGVARVFLKIEGCQPDRIVQGSRDDAGGLQGRGAGREGGHLRVDGQHVGLGRRPTRRVPASSARW